PFGLDLRLLDGYLPSYVAGLFNLVAGPMLAYNLTFVTGAVLNVVCARALARRLSSSRLVHAVTALAFLTAPPLVPCVQSGPLPPRLPSPPSHSCRSSCRASISIATRRSAARAPRFLQTANCSLRTHSRSSRNRRGRRFFSRGPTPSTAVSCGFPIRRTRWKR